MICHEVNYKIIGDDLQQVEVELDPGETVIAEAGSMNYMEQGIQFEAKMGDGSNPREGFFQKAWSAGSRFLSGESIFLTHFTNKDSNKRKVAFSSPYPGKILPLNLQEYGNQVICQKGAFLSAALGTRMKMHFRKNLGTGLFGGEGFILQRLMGDGMAFLHAGGSLIQKELNGGKLRVDTGCIVGFTSRIQYSIETAGNLKSMIFGGEGLFLTTLSGHGTVWIQSLPFSRLADTIIQHAPSIGGEQKGAQSLLSGIMKQS